MLARAGNVDGYENMSRKQLENIFATPSAPTPTPAPSLRPKKCITPPASRSKIRTPAPAPNPEERTPIAVNR